MFPKKRYAEKALMKKTLAMHDESTRSRKVDDNVHDGAILVHLLDRDTTTHAKVLSSTIKQKRKEKAGKWDVPLPKVRPVVEDEMFKELCSGKHKIFHLKMSSLKDEKYAVTDETMKIDGFTDEEMDHVSGTKIPLSEPSKNIVYNKEGLLEKLEEIARPKNLEWIRTLTINYNLAEEIDVNDDLSRELAFYNQTLDGAREAFEKLQSMGLPFLRPPNYYAEMVKSDNHMLKIKSRLLTEKKKIKEAEEKRKARESKMMAKEVQALKLKEKAKRKKEEIESVKKWRKLRQRTGFAGGEEEEMDFGYGESCFQRSNKRRPEVSPGDRSGGFIGKEKGKKTTFKENKFGNGGRKGLKKQNTAETTDDFSGFNRASKKRKR